MKTLIAAAALLMTATTASAIELGGGFALDTNVEGEYNTATELFTTTVTPKLSYSVSDAMSLWADTELGIYDGSNLNLNKNAFSGINVGIDYALPLGQLGTALYLESGFDTDWNHTRTLIGISLDF